MIFVLLMSSGFTLNSQVQHSIAIRYACSKLTIDFDGFVACMIRLETLFSKCICLSVKGDSWQFWVFIKFLIFLTVNVTDCTEMGECQQKCICLRNQKRNSKSFTGWMIMEREDMYFHNLFITMIFCLTVISTLCSVLCPSSCPISYRWYHSSLTVLIQIWFTGLLLYHIRCYCVGCCPCPAAKLSVCCCKSNCSTLWSGIQITCKEKEQL